MKGSGVARRERPVADYDAYTGKVTDRWAWVVWDPDGHAVREAGGVLCVVREYIDVGRSCDVQAAHPDATLAPEKFPRPDYQAASRRAVAKVKAAAQRRHAGLLAAMTELLTATPGLNTTQVAAGVGTNEHTAARLLQAGPFRVVKLGRTKCWYSVPTAVDQVPHP